MRDSRKIEDLILPFVTSATKSLKKEDELADGAWKYELNVQIALFLDLIADSLSSVTMVSGELSSRLENYRQRLREPAPEKDRSSIMDRPTLMDRASIVGSERGFGDRGDTDSMMSSRSGKPDGLRAKETEEVARLFGLTDEALTQKLRELQPICTEQVRSDCRERALTSRLRWRISRWVNTVVIGRKC